MIKAYAAQKVGGKLEAFEYEAAPIANDEVEVNVEFCGICHSDLSMLDNAWGMTQFPFVPGHEIVGSIAAVGDKVTGLKLGDKVGIGWHSGYCMSCTNCMSGDHNMCPTAEGVIVGRHGGFSDKVIAKAASVVPLPDGVDIDSAGPLFCGGITVFNPLVQFDVKPTDKVAVIGIGGLGHLALQFLNAWGCEVTAFTSSESKTIEAIEMGAHDTINSRDASEIAAAAGRFDFIISTVNVKLDWNAYVSTLATRGRLHFVGATLEPLDLAVFPLIGGQRSISGSQVGSPATIAKMLEFSAKHEIKPVVEHYKFDQVNEAMDHLKSGKARYRIVLSW